MVAYRLVRPDSSYSPPLLDAEQQAVVDHREGPLLVLAGPGTGKTTTLVEAIAARIEDDGVDPSAVLALTFSRKAAQQLRDRVTARLGRTLSSTVSSTFHSFGYGLIRRYAERSPYDPPLRLLSAPEQDVVLQELLADHPEAVDWPDALRTARGTRGFAREVQAVINRAREKGLQPADLVALGERHALPAYVAAGRFLAGYLDVLAQRGEIDYADVILEATGHAHQHLAELRARFSHVYVDEYQDTDPGQVALLRAIAGDGRHLVAVGDPHQSIYGFRGADVSGIQQFPVQFPRLDGRPADVVALRTTRRFGPVLLAASQSVACRLAMPIDPRAREAFLDPVAEAEVPGRVEVVTYDTERAETEHLADLLRRAHLDDGVPWSQMAVLVRSGRSSIPGLRRSLAAAGVPIEVAADDTPLTREPAVLPLLDALRAVVHLDVADPADGRPGNEWSLDPARAEALLLSPLAGLDATDIRAVARDLRRRHGSNLSSSALVRQAVLDPSLLTGSDAPGAAKVRSLGALLRRARAELDAGRTAEEVLWTLWSGTGWPARLTARVEAGGSSARMAHRDLDALCALFDTAARTEEQRGHTSVESFVATLTAQQIPADSMAERGVRGEGVRLLTAHRSKGLEWDLVVLAHAQEGAWPDLRRRSSLLQADRLGSHAVSDGLLEPVTTRALLAEERRLFYVACTRARQRLVVTAVRSPEDDGDQPSRFLAELDVEVDHVQGRPARPLSLGGLVADLRRTLADPVTSASLRTAAAIRLAALAEEQHAGRQLVPQADPATWWGTRGTSRASAPIRAEDETVVLSASSLTRLTECPAGWFLEKEAGGSQASTAAQGFGNLAHALAERVVTDADLAGADADGLMEHVDHVWERLTFRTPWSRHREREELRQALRRFLHWHGRAEARQVLGTETRLQAEVTLPDGQRVALYGYADRVELDHEGRVVVVDLKTGKYPPTEAEVKVHPQLGLYQLAVEGGATEHLAPGAEPGGAELWHLRREARGVLKAQAQAPLTPASDDVPRPIERQLMAALRVIRDEDFEARAGGHCDNCAFTTICPIKGSGTVLS